MGIPSSVSEIGSGMPPGTLLSYGLQDRRYDAACWELYAGVLQEIVQEGDVVIDAGSGTGIIGMLAVRYGASRAYCVAPNEESQDSITAAAEKNGMAGKIVVVGGPPDSVELDMDGPADVLGLDTLTPGHFLVPLPGIVRHMRQYLAPNGQVIPPTMNHYIEFRTASTTLYGLRFAAMGTRFALPEAERHDIRLSSPERFLTTEFGVEDPDTPDDVTARVIVRATGDGLVTGFHYSGDMRFFPNGETVEPTPTLLSPFTAILRESESFPVEAGKKYVVSLRYRAGDLPHMVPVDVSPA